MPRFSSSQLSDQLALSTIDPLADVLAWRQEFPEAWRAIVHWAHEDRDSGIDPSTRLYVNLLRRPHFAEMLGMHRQPGSPILVNDHISSGLARLLNREFPHLQCPTRKATVDGWGAVG